MYLEIDNYDEYAADLSPENQTKLNGFAATIVGRAQTSGRVESVSIIGHADQALRVPADERQKKEMQVSVERARTAADKLQTAISALPGGTGVLDNIRFMTSGVGSRERKVKNPQSDVDRRKNRRVELNTVEVSEGAIHVLPEWPRHEPDLSEPRLDKLFSAKLMEGVSAAPPSGPGVFQYTFVIWDKTESRAAAFDYQGVKISEGVDSPFASESDWNDFLVRPTISLENFSGEASHSAVTAPIGLMVLNTPQASIVIRSGLAMGASVESGMGLFSIALNSIQQPFNG